MWSRLGKSEYCYAISGDIGSELFQLSVTDFITVWRAEFCRAGFLAIIAKSNMHLEDAGSEGVLQYVLDMLRRTDTAECSFAPTPATATHTLTVVNRESGYPVRLQANLQPASAVDFYNAVTRPLLEAVQDLRASETTLCRILTDKDKEIAEYKAEGGQLLLKYLKTAPFDVGSHRAAHPACARCLGADPAPALAAALRPRSAVFRNEEPTPIKVETAEQRPQPSPSSRVPAPARVPSAVKREVKSEESSPSQHSKRTARKLLNL